MSEIRQNGTRIHVPVMPNEVLSHLNILKDGIYLDGTIGLGGHSSLILSQLSAKGHLIGIDRDEEALEICKKSLPSHKSALSLLNDSYHNINSILDNLEIEKVNGILLDLGLSSFQLNNLDRGFSFNCDSILDMRFDLSQKNTAQHIVNNIHEDELANIIFLNGEERRSRPIAKKIVKQKKNLIILFITSILIFLNWGTWIYAISINKIIDASYGYFIFPIFSVFLGYLFLKEKLNYKRKLSIFAVALSSIYLLFHLESFPWVGFLVAFFWCTYNLLRKKIKVDTDIGLFIESLFILPLALTIFYFINTILRVIVDTSFSNE